MELSPELLTVAIDAQVGLVEQVCVQGTGLVERNRSLGWDSDGASCDVGTDARRLSSNGLRQDSNQSSHAHNGAEDHVSHHG